MENLSETNEKNKTKKNFFVNPTILIIHAMFFRFSFISVFSMAAGILR